jgi:hypothetical protein
MVSEKTTMMVLVTLLIVGQLLYIRYAQAINEHAAKETTNKMYRWTKEQRRFVTNIFRIFVAITVVVEIYFVFLKELFKHFFKLIFH